MKHCSPLNNIALSCEYFVVVIIHHTVVLSFIQGLLLVDRGLNDYLLWKFNLLEWWIMGLPYMTYTKIDCFMFYRFKGIAKLGILYLDIYIIGLRVWIVYK